jgi:predicted Zn-dependent protease
MILSKEESKKLGDKILAFSKAESAEVNIYGSNSNNVRFAVNTVSTCGAINSISANITSNFGKKSGSVTITSIDDNAIETGVRKSEEIARLSPDSEEFMPPLERQPGYLDVKEYFEETASLPPESISNEISYTIENSISRDLVSAGYFENEAAFTAIRNTNDLFAYHTETSANFSTTVRTKDGTGSSKIERIYPDINRLDIKRLSDKVIDRAYLSRQPVEHPPGKYVTVLDNSAVSDMVRYLSWFMSKRNADEGRSFFSHKEKGNKIGEKIINEKVNIYSDPQSAESPSSPFNSEGYPFKRTNWFEDGVLKNLYMNRYWAMKTGSEYVPFPPNLIMTGSDKSLEDLIASTENGIFVSRLWYIRTVDSQQILLTGLTRDGIFLIENGKITQSIKNYRFNESPVNVLQNILDMSSSEKVVGSETGNSKIVVPALKLSEFNFSTISDAV